MALESVTHISDLVTTNPVGATDPKSQGDDHIRNIKTALKTDFPDVNAPAAAFIVSATAPTAPVAGTRWWDTTAGLIKRRNAANTAWITLAESAATSNSVDINAGTIDGATINANTLTANTITTGTIDNTPIGATTPSTGAFTTLTVSGAVTITNMIEAGTAMLFYQAAAPTGWTQVVTQNDKALRVVSGTGGGTGGTVAFETAFASQAVSGTNTGTAITQAQLPNVSLTHASIAQGGSGVDATAANGSSSNHGTNPLTISLGGSGATHTHIFTGTAIDLDVQYINVIIASKN